jgi:hypothetical protein
MAIIGLLLIAPLETYDSKIGLSAISLRGVFYSFAES